MSKQGTMKDKCGNQVSMLLGRLLVLVDALLHWPHGSLDRVFCSRRDIACSRGKGTSLVCVRRFHADAIASKMRVLVGKQWRDPREYAFAELTAGCRGELNRRRKRWCSLVEEQHATNQTWLVVAGGRSRASLSLP